MRPTTLIAALIAALVGGACAPGHVVPKGVEHPADVRAAPGEPHPASDTLVLEPGSEPHVEEPAEPGDHHGHSPKKPADKPTDKPKHEPANKPADEHKHHR